MDERRRSDLQSQLRQQVEDEFTKRTNEHRVKVHVINARRRSRQSRKLKAAPLPLDFLAVGDSWYDYPLNDFGVPWTNQDIIAKLQTIGNPSPIILPRALHGNAMTTTMGLNNKKQYVADLQDETQWLSGNPDAILVSGGGDDEQDQILVPSAERSAQRTLPQIGGGQADARMRRKPARPLPFPSL
jgi:hypothetical protein